MNSKYSLADIREVWINARRRGETDWLHFLEAPSFVARRGAIVMTKAQQIAFIERNRRSFVAARMAQPSMKEIEKVIVERDGRATISGVSETAQSDVLGARVSFVETWEVLDERWQITSLDIDEQTVPRWTK